MNFLILVIIITLIIFLGIKLYKLFSSGNKAYSRKPSRTRPHLYTRGNGSRAKESKFKKKPK